MATKKAKQEKKDVQDIPRADIEIKILAGIGFCKIEGNKLGIAKAIHTLLKSIQEDKDLRGIANAVIDHMNGDCKCESHKKDDKKTEKKEEVKK